MSRLSGHADAVGTMMRGSRLVVVTGALVAFAGCTGVATRSPDTTDDDIAMIAARLRSIQRKNQLLSNKLDNLEHLLKERPLVKAPPVRARSKPISRILKSTIKIDPFTLTLQRALKAAEYDPGPEDGKFGRRTTAALRKFQRENNLRQTGMADDDTLALLKRFFD